MSILKEFKEFAIKGNVMDLAIGVIIGGAFHKIVDSVVNDLIMPIVGMFGNSDFSNLYLGLNKATRLAQSQKMTLVEAKKLGPVFAWGNFITVSINFIILAFIIFLMVQAINRLKRKEAALPTLPVTPTTQEMLLTDIRDLLKNKNL
ncbi:MAG: large conductance mechanosensitive channel protein MscL [Opitutaceae bacterium]|nr:large conductance mechanosensitive channel protein MscL [Cytophagales bacterium]